MAPQPRERVPGPGPFCSTAPRMKEIRNTKAFAIVFRAVVKNPSGALSAGNMRSFKAGTQPTRRPIMDAIVGGGATLLNQPSPVPITLPTLLSCHCLPPTFHQSFQSSCVSSARWTQKMNDEKLQTTALLSLPLPATDR